jgi:hypothetical protein
MKAVSFEQLYEFVTKALWGFMRHLMSRLDSKKVQSVFTAGPKHEFWDDFIGVMKKHLMFVPGEGLHMMSLKTFGPCPVSKVGDCFVQPDEGQEYDLTDFDWRLFPESEDSEPRTSFAVIGISADIAPKQFFRKLLGRVDEDPQLIEALLEKKHFTTLKRIEEAIQKNGDFELSDAGHVSLFLVKGNGKTLRIVSVEYDLKRKWVIKSYKQLFSFEMMSGMGFYLANPENTLSEERLSWLK